MSAFAEQTLASLSTRERAAQILMPRLYAADLERGTVGHRRLHDWVERLGIGGVIVSRAPTADIDSTLDRLQSIAGIPLLVGADMEHGPGQVLAGATRFPPAMALGATGDPDLAFELGRITALEARAAGVHVAFAPVADVNNNAANPIINTRSYGADPEAVSRMVTAHIRGLQQHGMLAVAKHFPGHGDTVTDSHSRLPRIDVGRERAEAVELPPFRAAIAAGVAGIMTAHVAFPALTGDDLPATLSATLIGLLLRNELGFDGLVFTDGLDMGAIVNGWGSPGAARMALSAGADVLLQVPAPELEPVLDAVVEAAERDAAFAQRVDAAALRVLRAKASLALMPPTERAARAPDGAAATHATTAADAAARSITVVRDADGLLPIRPARLLTILYTTLPDENAGVEFLAGLAAAHPSGMAAHIDDAADAAQRAAIERQAAGADLVVFAVFVRVTAGGAGPGIGPDAVALAERLAAARPLVLVSFGSPYVLQQLPRISTFVVAWGQWQPAQTAAARALIGRAAVAGRLPTPIPPLHESGDGLAIHPRGGA